MALPTKRAISGLDFAAGVAREFTMDRGYLEDSVTIGYRGTMQVNGAGVAVKPQGTLVRSVEIRDTNGDLMHAVSGSDLITESLILEQAQLASLLTVPTGAGVATYTVSGHVTINFKSLFADNGHLTRLPTWMYPRALKVRVIWGDVTDLLTGTPTANLYTITPYVQANGVALKPDEYVVGRQRVDPQTYGAFLGRMYRGVIDVVPKGAGQVDNVLLPDTRDIRAVIAVAMTLNNAADTLDNPASYNDALISTLGVWVNGTTPIIGDVDYQQHRALSSIIYGVGMPSGRAILDFAEDRDITRILEAPKFNTSHVRIKYGSVVNALDRVRLIVLGIGA
jgi:hypothetical protein